MRYQYTDLAAFQQDGVRFLTDLSTYPNPNRILFDEMGLGKTCQAAYALKVIKAKRILIITLANPKVLKQWKEHLIQWAGVPSHTIQVVTSTNEKIRKPVVITNFEKITARKSIWRQLVKLGFDVAVIDECHKLKSMESQITKLMYFGHRRTETKPVISGCKRVWLLTGTLLPNRAFELYPHAKALFPDLLGKYADEDKFIEHFCGFMGLETRNGKELEKLMSPAMLRREKKDHLTDLLPIKVDKHHLEGIEMNTRGMQVPTVRRELAILKAPQVAEFITEQGETEEGMITVFTWHRAMTEFLRDNLQKCAIIYGSTPKKTINQVMNRVLKGKVKYLVLQLSSGGTGLDGIQHISKRIIMAEPDWVPGNYEQMIGRLHRWGQKMEVYLTVLIASGTIDEYVDWKRISKGVDLEVFNSKVSSKKVSFNEFKENFKTMADKELERIADALDALVEHFVDGKSSTKKTTKKPTKKESAKEDPKSSNGQDTPLKVTSTNEPTDTEEVDSSNGEVDLEAVRVKMIEVSGEVGREPIVAMFKKLGIESLTKAPEDKHQEIYDELCKLEK